MIVESKIKNGLSNAFKLIAPEIYWRRKLNYIRNNFSEIEMNLIPVLTNPNKISIDIGAATGSFLVNLSFYSKEVIGFEPIPKNINLLNQLIYYTDINASVKPYALSDNNGVSKLKMPKNDFGRSTIESINKLSDNIHDEIKIIDVVVKKLDEFNFEDVGFIKIDVEGHELSVLQGSKLTIIKNRPFLLVEIEERHRPNSIKDVADLFQSLDYSGYFILNKKIHSISEFNIESYQNSKNIGDHKDNYKRKGIYINNFIFLPKEKSEYILKNSQKLLDMIIL